MILDCSKLDAAITKADSLGKRFDAFCESRRDANPSRNERMKNIAAQQEGTYDQRKYAQLVASANAIKSQMESVRAKIADAPPGNPQGTKDLRDMLHDMVEEMDDVQSEMKRMTRGRG